MIVSVRVRNEFRTTNADEYDVTSQWLLFVKLVAFLGAAT